MQNVLCNCVQHPLGAATRLLAVLLAAAPLATVALAQSNFSSCGSLDNPYGPFDYRVQKGKLNIVEQYHFTPNVESLVSGKSSIHVGGDLDYTLRASPNHHRALIAMMRLGEKLKTPQPQGLGYSVECYFERALRFRPDDSIARMIYATYLFKNSREPEAVRQLALASESAGDNPFTHYNIGLIYLDLKKYDQALAQAHKAYGLGFVQPVLREQLKKLGKWKEPSDTPPNAPATSDETGIGDGNQK